MLGGEFQKILEELGNNILKYLIKLKVAEDELMHNLPITDKKFKITAGQLTIWYITKDLDKLNPKMENVGFRITIPVLGQAPKVILDISQDEQYLYMNIYDYTYIDGLIEKFGPKIAITRKDKYGRPYKVTVAQEAILKSKQKIKEDEEEQSVLPVLLAITTIGLVAYFIWKGKSD